MAFFGGLNGDGFFDEEYNEAGISFGDNGSQYEPNYNRNYTKSLFKKNKWFYHRKVKVEIVTQTDLAYLVEDKIGTYWIPKKLLHFGKKHTRQYKDFDIKYNEMFNKQEGG